jgi:type III secretion protein HrpB1
MSFQPMQQRLTRKAFLDGWHALAAQAIAQHLLDDAATVVAGIQALQPDAPQSCLLQARLMAKRGDYREAIRLLRELEASPTHWSQAKAWIASCQYLDGDAGWEISVGEVLQRDDAEPDARRFAQCLQDADLLISDSTEPVSDAAAAAPAAPVAPLELGYGVFMRA